MSVLNYIPANSATVPLAVTTTSANVALPSDGNTLLVQNIGASAAWIKAGNSAVAATASTGDGICIPSGKSVPVRINPQSDTHLAAITAASTTTLSISVCRGAACGF